MDVLDLEIVSRVLAGLVFGALIGFERQWRGRAAGIRTNALVCLGAALFTSAGALMVPEGMGYGDPSRVAAQVVSGIGFLGAGVIMKHGAAVSGINTAATLWASAAVGTLAGAGLMWLAALGSVLVMGANMLLRPVASLLDGRETAPEARESMGTEYTFEVRCMRDDELVIRDIVFDAVHRPGFVVRSISSTDQPGDIVVVSATVFTLSRDDENIEDALAQLLSMPEVLGIRWEAESVESGD
ncbi:hypothetical protein C1878_09740 [Gordonibacter sp. 28C]|uniref:MgtC/SapB family protein n=1 Tax=Gordonibacter sp. 28C TaxID=2078569 RepID=UPI000DF819F9|nr:MgtC/SapB family protein [Gordonibacter sp. 28C]RDB61690.1 hypothetical protein C1878_09740 [Gordonibacter sp. 28C]